MADRSARPVLPLSLDDVIRLSKPHPCGGDTWRIDRLGADIGLRCTTCGRRVLLERAAVERRLAGFVERADPPTGDRSVAASLPDTAAGADR
jgi:hypothetical protein